MFGRDRQSIRQFFLHCRQKQLQGERLESLEHLVAEVIAQHPEYHAVLDRGEAGIEEEFNAESGQTNPFLHMGMHISLSEQLAADHPKGVRTLYQQLLLQWKGDVHGAEHQMMECLGLSLWEAQRQQRLPDEIAYLECLKKLLK